MSQQINLYNPAFIPPRQLLTATSLAVCCGVLLTAVVGLGIWSQQRSQLRATELANAKAELQAVKTRVDTLRAQIDARQANPELTREINGLKARIAQREQLIGLSVSALGEPGQGYAEFLRSLARNSAPGIWLTALSVGERGGSIALSGRASRKELVPDYVKRLNAEPAFRGKNFGGLRMEMPSEKPDAATAAETAKPERSNAAPYAFDLLAAGALAASAEIRK